MLKILLLVFSGALLPLAAMNGFYSIGWGTRSIGMGGVAQALPQETLVVASNPAGMVWLQNRIDLGAGWLRLPGATTLSGSSLLGADGTYRSHQSIFVPEAGASRMTSSCSAVGIALYLHGAFDVKYERPLPTEGTSPGRGRYRQYMVSPTWSVKTCCNHGFGIALNIAIGTLLFEGLEKLAADSIYPSNFTNRGQQTVWGLGLTVGWLAEFFERLRLGLSYQTRTWSQHATHYKGLLPNKGEIRNPSTFSGGIGIMFTPYLIFGLDLGWIFWSDVAGFGNQPHSGALWGSKHGPSLGWRDQVVCKLGISYELNDSLTIRTGYNYGRNPIAPNSLDNNWLTLATTEHHLSVGITWGFWCNALSLAYVHGFNNNVTGPIAQDRGGGRQTLSGHQDQLMASWGFHY